MQDEKYTLGRVNKRFFARWQDESGQWKRAALGTTDPVIAKARFAQWKQQLAFQEKSGEALTVAAIYDAYVKDRKTEGKVAVPRMQDAWKHLKPTFGALLPSHVNKALCRSYQAERTSAGAGPGTIHVELGYLRAALKFARREDWIKEVPVVVLPQKPEPKEHYLTRNEAKRLIDSASLPHLKLFIILALATAGRASAILDLTWDRVDLSRRIIKLRDPEKATTSKGRATVPINDWLYAALVEAKKGAISSHVIEWGGKRVGSMKKGVSNAAARAKLVATPHVLRHSAAVWMAEARVPMSEIAQYLGHRDSRTTERVYARYSPGYLQEAASALVVENTQFSLVRNGPRKRESVATGRSKKRTPVTGYARNQAVA